MANNSTLAYPGDRSIIERELDKLLKQPDRRANIERIKKLLIEQEGNRKAQGAARKK